MSSEHPTNDASRPFDHDPGGVRPAREEGSFQIPEGAAPPDPDAAPSAGGMNRFIVWSLLAALVIGIFFVQRASQAGPTAADLPKDTVTLELRMMARFVVGIREFARQQGGSQEQDLLDEAETMVDTARDFSDPPTALGLVRIAIMERELEHDEDARATLDEAANLADEQLDALDARAQELQADLDQLPADQHDERAALQRQLEQTQREREGFAELREDIDEFRVVFSDAEPANAQRLIDRHGWWAEFAFSQDLAHTDPARKPFLNAGMRTIFGALAFIVVLIVGVLASIGCVAAAVYMLATGRLRAKYTRIVQQDQRQTTSYAQAVVLFLVGFLVLGGLVAYLEQQTQTAWPMLLLWLLGLCALWPMVVGGRSFTQTRNAMGWTTGGRGVAGVLREIVAGIFGYFALTPIFLAGFVLTFILLILVSAIGATGEQPTHPLGVDLQLDDPVRAMILASLAVLWAPIVEETLFRGALFHQLRFRLAAPLAAILSGFIFAIIHPQGWVAAPVLTALGINFALIREWRGSIIGPIVAHAMHNGAIVLMIGLMFA